MTSTGDHRVVACTVATRAQLPATRALGTSYLEHHPEHDFVAVDLEDPPDWLGISEDEYLELATAHDVGELTEVITPQVVRGLLEKYDVVVKLPPRALVLAPLASFGSPDSSICRTRRSRTGTCTSGRSRART